MHSNLIITMRRIQRDWNKFPNALYELEKDSKELWRFFRETFPKQPEIAKNHALMTYDELLVQEKRILEIFENDNTETSAHYLEVLHVISNEKGNIVSNLATLYPDLFINNGKWLEQLRNDLPKYDNVRRRIEAHLELKETRRKKRKRSKVKNMSLNDIWANSEMNNYDLFISHLCSENLHIDGKFVSKESNGLRWNEKLYGSNQYIKAFILILRQKKWIPEEYSSREYQAIITNTFLFYKPPHRDVFKSINANPPKQKYIKPFKHFLT